MSVPSFHLWTITSPHIFKFIRAFTATRFAPLSSCPKLRACVRCRALRRAMASTLDLVSALDTLPERKERLRKVLAELESKKIFSNENGALWDDVEEYLSETETTLRRNLEEYQAKEMALEERTKEAKEVLQKTDTEVSQIEQASLARVQEQMDAALALLSEMKQKWLEEKVALEKEEAKHKNTNEPGENDLNKEMHIQAEDDILKALDMDVEFANKDESTLKEVVPRPELVDLCKAMEPDKLLSFMVERRKELAVMGDELPFAMKFASDPAQLVLKALNAYYTPEASRDTLVVRRACIIMLESLAELLTDEERFTVSPEIKQAAKEVADLWISKFNFDNDIGPTLALEAQSFLQLGATFKLEYDYNQDDLCKLVMLITRRKYTPALCRTLGLSSKIPDAIESLIKDGKQIEAISFAGAFDLLDCFEPVALLKAYLKDQRKSAQAFLQNGNNTAAAKNEANQKELLALRAVLRAIHEYKLEEKYPSALLEKRVAQLERAKQDKQDKKRTPYFGKAEYFKRPRMSNGGPGIGHLKPVLAIPDRAHYAVGATYGGATQYALGAANPYGAIASQYGMGIHASYGTGSQYGPGGVPQAGYGVPPAGYGGPQAGYGAVTAPQAGYGGGAAPQAGFAPGVEGYDQSSYGSGHYQHSGVNRGALSWSDAHSFPSDGLSYASTVVAFLNASTPYTGQAPPGSDTGAAPVVVPGALTVGAPGTVPSNYVS